MQILVELETSLLHGFRVNFQPGILMFYLYENLLNSIEYDCLHKVIASIRTSFLMMEFVGLIKFKIEYIEEMLNPD